MKKSGTKFCIKMTINNRVLSTHRFGNKISFGMKDSFRDAIRSGEFDKLVITARYGKYKNEEIINRMECTDMSDLKWAVEAFGDPALELTEVMRKK